MTEHENMNSADDAIIARLYREAEQAGLLYTTASDYGHPHAEPYDLAGERQRFSRWLDSTVLGSRGESSLDIKRRTPHRLPLKNGPMRFRVLGPLEIWDGEDWNSIGAPKWRSLLAVLLINAGKVVSTDRLITEIWGDSPPRSATNLVSVYALRLRKMLGGDSLLRYRAPGYLLAVGHEEVDSLRFATLVDAGRQALAGQQPQYAAELMAEALGVWRGRPYMDVLPFSDLVEAEIARLEAARLDALELSFEAEIGCGRHASVTPELSRMTTDHPLRERPWGLLMRALDGAGRHAEALAAYARAREVIADELGVDPGEALQSLYKQILARQRLPTQSAPWSNPAVSGRDLYVRTDTLRLVAVQLRGMAGQLQNSIGAWTIAVTSAASVEVSGTWREARQLSTVITKAHASVRRFLNDLAQAHNDAATRLAVSADRYEAAEHHSPVTGLPVEPRAGKNPRPTQTAASDRKPHKAERDENPDGQTSIYLNTEDPACPASYGSCTWRQIQEMLAVTDPDTIITAGIAYKQLSLRLTGVTNALARQGQVLANSWSGPTAVIAVKQLQQLHQTAAGLQADTWSVGDALQGYGLALAVFKSSPPHPASAHTAEVAAANTPAGQHMAALNQHLQTAFSRMPATINKNLPPTLATATGVTDSSDKSIWGAAESTDEAGTPGMMPLGDASAIGQERGRIRQAWTAEEDDVWGAVEEANSVLWD